MRLANSLVLSCLWISACTPAPAAVEPSATRTRPSSDHEDPARAGLRLVVQITVDQLRADLPERVLSRVDPGGFRRLYEQAVVYENAHYAHAITETAPGHATLFTGAHPREHGIIANEWLSPSGEPVFVVDDPATALVGGAGTGASPRNLLLSTIGDALRAHTSDRALVFAVSEKDRGAVLPAGKTGTAYWLDDNAGAFVSSTHYMQALPDWLRACSESLEVGLLRGERWSLMDADARYSVADDLPFEAPGAGGARTFPHVLDADDTRTLTRQIKRSPFGDALVLDFVRELLTHEPIGRDEIPDLLAVSFSATDYVGHSYGPESREAEDNLLRLDRTLASLFELLDRRVGLGRTLVVLSADHGISESPEWLHSQGKPAGRHDAQALVRELNHDLRAAFGVEVDLVRAFVNPSIWLSEDAIAKADLTISQVAAKAAELLRAHEGVAAAFVRDEMLDAKPGAKAADSDEDGLFRAVSVSVHPERSGHVYVVPKRGWLLATDAAHLTAMHGTPWPYDSHVPILILAPGLAAQRVARAVDPRAIAPTIAGWLGLPKLPGASSGALVEALPRDARHD